MNIPKLLEMTDEQFIEWASKQLVEKPWTHIRDCSNGKDGGRCWKCGKVIHKQTTFKTDCPVPDPIKFDWNTAKEWQGKCRKSEFIEAISKVSDIVLKDIGFYEDWILLDVEPRHYLIATVLCLGE